MKAGGVSKIPGETPAEKAEKLMKLFPEKYRGYNTLAGKVVLMVVKDHRLLSGSYRKSNRLWEVKNEGSGH